MISIVNARAALSCIGRAWGLQVRPRQLCSLGVRLCHTSTRAAYRRIPFGDWSPAQRGATFEKLARHYDDQITEFSTDDPEPAWDINGNRCVKSYDWKRKTGDTWCRVEAKSAQMIWDRSSLRWLLRFVGVKFSAFDVLVMVVYAPWGLELWEYDLHCRAGVSTTGKAMDFSGQSIVFYGKSNEHCVVTSWSSSIRPCLSRGAKHVVSLDWTHSLINMLWLHVDVRTREYMTVPFSRHSGRSLVFQEIARLYDDQYRHYTTDVPQPGIRIDGRRRGPSAEAYDWTRTQFSGLTLEVPRRVEVKSAQFIWERPRKRWLLRFSWVKLTEFDDLVLVIYAPWGLELWDYDIAKCTGLTSCGKATAAKGHFIVFYGKCEEESLRKSWESYIRLRLRKGAKHVATLNWEHPLVTAHPCQ